MSYEEILLLESINAKQAIIIIDDMANRWASRNDTPAQRMRIAIDAVRYCYSECIYEPLTGVDETGE